MKKDSDSFLPLLNYSFILKRTGTQCGEVISAKQHHGEPDVHSFTNQTSLRRPYGFIGGSYPLHK